MSVQREWPTDRELRQLFEDHSNNQTALAQTLGVPRTTLQDRLRTIGILDGRKDTLPDELSHDVSKEELPVFYRDYSHLDHLYVYPLGDVHIGAQSHDRARWKEWLSYLKTASNVSLLGTGDFLNAAIVGSKSDVYDETMTLGDAKRSLYNDLKPIANKGKLDLLMPGNHEMRAVRATGDCPIQDIAHFLEVPYTKAAAMIVYKVGDVEYEFFVRHGTGNGQSLVTLFKGAMVAKADVFITGHTHRQACTADEYFVREGSRMVRKRRYYVSSGSFLGYESYAAERGYAPTRIGAPRVYLSGSAQDVHVSI